jgi:hypothetical protein
MPEPDLTWVDELLQGIDKDESEDGWWPTSTGVEFGAGKLAELKDEITRRYHRPAAAVDGLRPHRSRTAAEAAEEARS